MELIVVQAIVLVLLLVGTFVCGTLPIVIVRALAKRRGAIVEWSPESENSRCLLVLPFLMCLGGGVLFATCFLHLIPEVNEAFEKYYDDANNAVVNVTDPNSKGREHKHGIPLPELTICMGFMLVYLIEEVFHAVLGHNHCAADKVHIHGHSHSPMIETCAKRDEQASDHETQHTEIGISDGLLSNGHSHKDYGATDSLYPTSIPDTPVSPTTPRPSGHGHSHGSISSGKEQKSPALQQIRSLLIVVALSFHSVFEGLAVGLQPTVEKTWTLFFAIAVHKYVIAFVVGLELLGQNATTARVISYMLIFSVMSPLGIGAGIITEGIINEATDAVIGVLNALATGTIMYVTFFEVLQRERNSQLPGLLQLLAIFIGFGLMFVIQIFAET